MGTRCLALRLVDRVVVFLHRKSCSLWCTLRGVMVGADYYGCGGDDVIFDDGSYGGEVKMVIM